MQLFGGRFSLEVQLLEFSRMTDPPVHVFVACTNRKSRKVKADLRLRSVQRDFSKRAPSWINRISGVAGEVPAADLYSGESWFVARELRDDLDGLCSLWALSAGFGLVHADDLLVSYSATLSAGHPDSVFRSGDQIDPTHAIRRWWSSVSDWAGPTNGSRQRSIESVAAADPDSAMAVCVGRAYLAGVADDLAKATTQLSDPQRLMIFGSGGCPDPRLANSWIQVPAKIRQSVGGSLASLSMRAARHVLALGQPTVLNAYSARSALSTLTQSLDELPQIRRRRLTDDEIVTWITAEARRSPCLTKTTALRKLRNSGRACEQSRFGDLFDESAGDLR